MVNPEMRWALSRDNFMLNDQGKGTDRHSSISIFDQLQWLPLTARVQLKIFILTYRSCLGLTPKNLCNSIRRPTSAGSLRPHRSPYRLDLFVPYIRTDITQSRVFVSIGPSLLNQLPLRSVPP